MVKKIIVILFIVIGLLVSGFLIAINSINYNLISNYLVEKLNISEKSIGEIKIQKFPIPRVVIDNIKEEGELELQDIEVSFNLLSLLRFKPEIKVIKINNMTIYSDQSGLDIINHDKVISLYLIKDFKDINFDVKNLGIIGENKELIISFSHCYLTQKDLFSNKILFKGKLQDSSIKFSGFIEKKDKQTDFDLTIYNDDYNLHLLENYVNNKLVNGKGEYIVQNLASVLNHLVPELNLFFRKLNQTEDVSVKFDILPTEELIKLENLIIDSASFSAKGLMYLGKNDNIKNIINLTFSKIDIRTLVASSNDISNLTDTAYGLRFIFGEKTLTGNISADQIILNNGEILSNTRLLMDLKDSILVIPDFSGTIGSGGKFQFIGNITQNSVRSVFDGSVHLQHKDLNTILNIIGQEQLISSKPTPFNLSSDLKLTLIDIFLQNLLIKTNDTKVEGSIITRFIGSMPHILANLNFSSINLIEEGYPVISPMIDLIKGLTKDMKASSYLTKYIPFRTIGYLGNFDIIINDLLIGDKSFGKTYILANASPGNVEITNFDLRNDNLYINLSGKLLANSIKPQLEIQINDGNFNISPIAPTILLDIRNKLLNEFDLEKIGIKLDILLATINWGDLIWKDLRVSLSNDNTLLKIEGLKSDILGGGLEAEGNILLSPYTLNFVYALNSIDLAKLSIFFTKEFLDNQGGVSINGNFSATGDSLEKLLYNLTSKSDFIIKSSRINNFSIDSLIEKVNSKNYDYKNLKNDMTIALSQGQTGVNSAYGSLSLEKGVITIQDILFNTKYTSGVASLVTNIYNSDILLNSIFSFYINYGGGDGKLPIINVNVTAKGNISNIIRTADDTELENFLTKGKNPS
ncbi:MAG: AsmA-like C-terminal region-containing protein [Rickettsia endosymbiont of Bryobia graminum]|nr:AsmA-like C-terminal region-containing protein [Rickettsia endosymbiont of Bryobia graminum]